MKQLSGMDASFLAMETATMFGHVSSLAVFERPDEPGWSPYEAYRHQLERRLPLLPPLRWRAVPVPLDLDRPYWIEDPEFDLDYHLRETAVPRPGSDRQLAELVSRLVGHPLDRSRPLWEAYVIDGLDEGRFAVLSKIHHAAIDGASGVEVMSVLFDEDPDPAARPVPADERVPERVPNGLELLARSLADAVGRPRRLVRLQVRSLRAIGELTRNQGLTGLASLVASVPNPLLPPPRYRDHDRPPPAPRGQAPATPFNRAITSHRKLALRAISLPAVKAIKNAVPGATVNDVVMAVCAGGLRRYLQESGALPDAPLVAMVPVSIRTGEEAERWTNRVSAVFAPLPTDVDDPLRRLGLVHEAMDQAKDRFLLMPADTLTDFAEFPPPALAARGSRMATRLRIADRMRPPFNLVLSNVPGPRQPLYMAGACLAHYYPVSAIGEGVGLNITVQSYQDTIDVALLACRELLPDLDDLADAIVEEVAVLGAAAGTTIDLRDAELPPVAMPEPEPAPVRRPERQRQSQSQRS